MFNALNIGYSTGIHLKYSGRGSLSPVFHFFSNLIIFIAYAGIIAIIISLKIT
jgi:hypothetical protein